MDALENVALPLYYQGVSRRERNRPFTLAEALGRADDDPRAMLLVNTQSGRAAVQVPAPSLMLDDGEVERRVRLLRPMERTAIPKWLILDPLMND